MNLMEESLKTNQEKKTEEKEEYPVKKYGFV